MMPTFLVYSDQIDPSKATIYVEAGEVAVVPPAHTCVSINGIPFSVIDLIWSVLAPEDRARSPEQHVIVLVSRVRVARSTKRRRKP